MTDQCRYPSCSTPTRDRGDGVDGYAARFCSTRCELKYDHIRADAKDARLNEANR